MIITCESRIAELEKHVLEGTADRTYCLKWISIHQSLIDARRP